MRLFIFKLQRNFSMFGQTPNGDSFTTRSLNLAYQRCTKAVLRTHKRVIQGTKPGITCRRDLILLKLQ